MGEEVEKRNARAGQELHWNKSEKKKRKYKNNEREAKTMPIRRLHPTLVNSTLRMILVIPLLKLILARHLAK